MLGRMLHYLERHDNLLCHVSMVLGHPVWNLRTKTPQNEQATVPWHQDNAYLDNSALHALQPTAWIPLIDTNMKNGCMQVSTALACIFKFESLQY